MGVTGELLVARIRLVLLAILLVLQFVPGATPDIRRVTLPLNLLAIVVGVLFYVLAARRTRPWLEGYASSAADVTLVSTGLAAFLLLGQPHIAVNSWTLFELYFLAIAAAGLRYNPQACALTGLLAVAEYAAIVLYAVARWNLNDPSFAPFAYGTFDWQIQSMRLLLLAAAALVSGLIVLRMQGLRRLSVTDRLTGVANRRAFDERLAQEASRSRRYARPLTLAFVDVDDFKRINDSWGHAGGDEVLRAVARMLGRSIRETDLVARLGGDEFALLLPETTAELVVPRLRSLGEAVAAAEIAPGRERRPNPVRVTLSIGVASWPDDGAESEEVVATADARLYEAKRRGRGEVVGPPPDAGVKRPEASPPGGPSARPAES